MVPKFEYVGEARNVAKTWVCPDPNCRVENIPVQKQVFKIPKLICDGCGARYLDIPGHSLKFSLADVKANGEPLVRKVYDQGSTPECMAFACVQTMEIMNTVSSVLEGQQPKELQLRAGDLYRPYNKKYPSTGRNAWDHDCYHKFIKMSLTLRSNGLPDRLGTLYKIGDVSTIPMSNYEQIVEELADGTPLLAVFYPGISMPFVSYGQMYLPPLLTDVLECDSKTPVAHHSPHMVTLLGPDCCPELRGFDFMNTWGEKFCPRRILEDEPNAVSAGIGKYPADSTIWNIVKFWQPGETCFDPDSRLEDETGDYNSPSNQWKMGGMYWQP